MKYVVENESFQVVKTVESDNIRDAVDLIEEDSPESEFYFKAEGTQTESAYNGDLTVRRYFNS